MNCKIGVFVVAMLWGATLSIFAAEPPNFVFILADDLGYGDLGCFGRKDIRTPNLDKLAAQGVRFTSHYANGAECTPTRTALLTGRYPQWIGGLECAIGTGNVGRYDDAIRLAEAHDLGLPTSEQTIVRLLRDREYATCLSGKWHLGYEPKFAPNLHGFQRSFYCVGGGMDYFGYHDQSGWHNLYEDGHAVNRTGYFSDLLTDHAIQFLSEQESSRPFFLYVPFTAPHSPYQGPEDEKTSPLPLKSPIWNQGDASPDVYLTMIESMDANIGRILTELESKGLAENTVIFFASDNGGTRSARNAPCSGFKGMTYDGGIRVPGIVRWPRNLAAGQVCDVPCLTFDFTKSMAVLAGVQHAEDRPFEGIDILGHIVSGTQPTERDLFWRKQRDTTVWKAVRRGSLKYVATSTADSNEEFLFDLDSDPSEKNNLKESQADTLRVLRDRYVAWEAKTRKNRRGQPTAAKEPGEASQPIPEAKQLALDWLDQPGTIDRFGRISDTIWSYAELGLEEYKSSALLIETLKGEGFTIDKGLAGMPTCFVASYGSGKPVIGILAEYDALPMISQKAFSVERDPVVDGAPGHGCGHNMMGSAAAAAAIAIKRSMQEHQLDGTIKYFGSPAEEMLVSRPFMIRAGLFEGVDAVINNHASSEFKTDFGVRGSAAYSVIFRFEGKTAHGASAWGGKSALDAVEIMNVAANFLREHLHFSHRMHYVIPHGGEAPNVVPDKASVWYYLRGSDDQIQDTFERVVNCAKGAALASGTTLSEVRVIAATHQAHHNRTFTELMNENVKLVGMPVWSDEDNEFARRLQGSLQKELKGMPKEVGRPSQPDPVFVGGASSDHGDVTLVTPTATLQFPGKVPGVEGHHWSTVACGFGTAAHKGLNAGAKVMAATAIDLLTRPEALSAIQNEFRDYSKKHPYQSFLPEDAKPPLDINAELMDHFIPLMQPFYKTETGHPK